MCLDRVPRAGDTPSFTSDEEGLTFDNLDAAKREAATAAAEIGRDRPPKGDSREITVEARNEHCQWVLTVKVSLEADRVEPPSQPSHWWEIRLRTSDQGISDKLRGLFATGATFAEAVQEIP